MNKSALPLLVLFTMLALPSPAHAAELGAGSSGWIGMGAGLGMGLAALGCGLGQGRAAASALEGIARNPGAADKMQTPLLIGLVFMETLVLFTFGFGFLLQSGIPS